MSRSFHCRERAAALHNKSRAFIHRGSSSSSADIDNSLQRNLNAIRIGFNSDMQHIGSFFANSLNRSQDAVPDEQSDSSRHQPRLSSLLSGLSSSPRFSSAGSACDFRSLASSQNELKDGEAMDGKAKWSPHSPRSVLQAMVPDNMLQRESLEMLLLQASPSHSDVKASVWKGCSVKTRAAVWRMLFDCEPLAHADRSTLLAERRREYEKLQRIMGAPRVGSVGEDDQQRSDVNTAMLRQIDMDLPRTHPNHPVFHCPRVRSAMRRVLYLFASLHPDSGYVQGQNEVLTPLLIVFMSEHVPAGHTARSVEGFVEVESVEDILSEEQMAAAEADAYWCLAQLVSGIVENYTVNQPGMHLRISQLEKLLTNVDPPLAAHMNAEGCQVMQFAFRWIAVLMLREFALPLIVRLWDALLAQRDGFGEFLVYLAAALTVNWRDELLQMEFTQMITLLLNLPTGGWTTDDIDILVSQARVWSNTYKVDELANDD